MTKRPYLKESRLADVLAMIQVLALDEFAHRTENGLRKELQGTSSSAESWIAVAREHPEFFRIRTDLENEAPAVSLVARHVLRPNASGIQEMPLELIQKLFQAAIELHDRQVSAAEKKWKYLVPLFSALIGSASTLLTQWITSLWK
jgi:hypothetical protein